MKILNPVILPVPESQKQVMGRKKVQFLSAHARKALDHSARLSQVTLGEVKKNTEGVPIPSQGLFWSLTHKPLYVGGVVSNIPTGIDIEQIRAITPGLFKKVAKEDEWSLGRDIGQEELFFRYWTSKEAVIKAQGTGIRDMLKCEVIEIPDKYSLVLVFSKKKWIIEHKYFDSHLVSIVRDDAKIHWTILSEKI